MTPLTECVSVPCKRILYALAGLRCQLLDLHGVSGHLINTHTHESAAKGMKTEQLSLWLYQLLNYY